MRRFWPLLATLLILAAPAVAQDEPPAPPARTAELASADAVELQSLYARHQDKFEGIYGNVSVSGTSVKETIALCEEHLARIEMLETEVLPELEPVLARITETWGPPPDENEGDVDAAQHAMNIGGDIEWNMKMAASGNDARAARDLPEQFDHLSSRYSDLVRMLNDVQKTRVANAEYLSTFVQNIYSPETIDFVTEDVRVPKLQEAKTLLGFAVRFDPGNEFANDRLATIDAEIDAMAKAIEDGIDAKRWAGNAEGAPGQAAAGLTFLRAHPNWGKNENGTEVLAVCVRGGWVPGERDIFGRIISWGLPVQVAVTKPAWREQNRARVYELTLITQEGAPSRAPKAPPFAKYWVGNSWYMRPGNLP